MTQTHNMMVIIEPVLLVEGNIRRIPGWQAADLASKMMCTDFEHPSGISISRTAATVFTNLLKGLSCAPMMTCT